MQLAQTILDENPALASSVAAAEVKERWKLESPKAPSPRTISDAIEAARAAGDLPDERSNKRGRPRKVNL
jgi:hypothetical protein